jgi:hypothetical protein
VGKRIVLGTVSPHWLGILTCKLDDKALEYHAAIFGKSGSGKSKLLQSLFLQHAISGSGIGVIEPHHDLSFDCLASLVSMGFYNDPESYKRVIYIDWGNGGYVPFNVLNSNYEHHDIAQHVLDAFHRVWPALGLGAAPAFDNIIKRGVRVLLSNHLPLTFLERLVTDHEWRHSLLMKVTDEGVLHYWNNFFDEMKSSDQLEEIKSTVRRLSLLTDNPLLKLTLGQPDNFLNFREIMDQGRIIIINLGNINNLETRKLIGALLMIQIEQAAMSRTNLIRSERRHFTLLVDEWPAFAAQQDTIAHVLSQCRKYNLHLYLAAQSTSQVEGDRLDGALENCKLRINFGLGRSSAENQAKHIGMVDPMLIKEEQFLLTQHNQYSALNEQWEVWTQELQTLKPREAYVRMEGKPAVKIRTLNVPEPKNIQHLLPEVLERYKTLYQRTKEDAEQHMAQLTVPRQPAINQLL